MGVGVGDDGIVCVGAVVEVGGTSEAVIVDVTVGVEKSGVLVGVLVGVEKSIVLVRVGVAVAVMPGVLVGTFGTQST